MKEYRHILIKIAIDLLRNINTKKEEIKEIEHDFNQLAQQLTREELGELTNILKED